MPNIIGGKYKRTNLVTPKGKLLRPTSGLKKQAIFNILQLLLICCGVKLFSSPLILIAITPKVIGFIIFK